MAATAIPCCGVAPSGETIHFDHQTNIVWWDDINQMEHFIRRAEFSGAKKSLGFLAPTPSVPKLGEASPRAFEVMASFKPQPASFGCAGGMKAAEGAASAGAMLGSPTIVQDVQVAGYRAVTLKATDSAGLSKWLNEHDYKTTRQVDEWVAHYVKKQWFITAFLVEGGVTKDVIMSFKTATPFNPFYVPDESLQGTPGMVDIYLVTRGDGELTVGQGGLSVPAQWDNEIARPYAGSLGDRLGLTEVEHPEDLRVTYFSLPFRLANKEELYVHVSRHWEVEPFYLAGVVFLVAWRAALRVTKAPASPT